MNWVFADTLATCASSGDTGYQGRDFVVIANTHVFPETGSLALASLVLAGFAFAR